MTPLRLEAPAKLNLSLAVTGRRADGFHELDSELVLLELADRLLLLPGCSGLRLEGDGSETLPIGRENLAWRGLLAAVGRAPDLVCLTLEKRIPVAAGLGGGSSDAAAAWRLGRRSEQASNTPDAATLAQLSSIGADVPFFAAQVAAARVTGIGERVSPLPEAMEAGQVVLAHPPFALSTAAVFAELQPAEWSGQPERGRNDLLAPAVRLLPAIEDVLRLMVAAGGAPQLTGSGPTVFAITDDPERAAAITARLQRGGLRATHTRLRAEPASIEAIEEPEE
ncbi:MAG TPA: 4-(cytidine 5'-diphospho)-2-C-methyl-D-erythritol kinase [Candidatus Limnocylindria bacterium]|nr:4-(cytidine 5'-diphospho)-2-C-methyl-D-erythritol kinase [Candidatus Limnocylindria bacterium]